MRKLRKLAFLVPVPLILGFILNLIGNKTDNAVMTKIGVGIMAYGTTALMFILVVIGLIFIITGRLGDGGGKDNQPLTDEATPHAPNTDAAPEKAVEEIKSFNGTGAAAEEEAERIAEINSSYGYESKIKLAEYQMDQTANIYKNSSQRDKVLGWLFFGFLMTDFALILVFAFIGILVGALVCFCIFAGTILLSLIIKVILEKTAISARRRKGVEYVTCRGVVKACVLSSMGSSGGARRYSTVRVNSVTYRVIIIVDGREYNTYSKQFYDTGEQLTVSVRKDGKGGVIIENSPNAPENVQ